MREPQLSEMDKVGAHSLRLLTV